MDKVIDEKFDEFNRYSWTNSSGVKTTVYQEEGLDLVITQEQNGDSRSVWHYSEAGMYLFSALLACQKLATTTGQIDRWHARPSGSGRSLFSPSAYHTNTWFEDMNHQSSRLVVYRSINVAVEKSLHLKT